MRIFASSFITNRDLNMPHVCTKCSTEFVRGTNYYSMFEGKRLMYRLCPSCDSRVFNVPRESSASKLKKKLATKDKQVLELVLAVKDMWYEMTENLTKRSCGCDHKCTHTYENVSEMMQKYVEI